MTPALEARRRQVTVLFFDLVGSTSLAERLDPEDLHGVLRTFQIATARRAQENGGYLLDTPGDGFAVLFGYPLAQEDAARRAVQAGLEIVQVVNALELDPGLGVPPLQVRVGIEAGEVVLGAVSEYDTRGRAAPTGRAPIAAARIQSVAEPGTVAVGPIAHELIRHRFRTTSVGRHRLKGIEGELEVFRAITVRSPGVPRTPMVGRDEQLRRLLLGWEAARRGDGRAFDVSSVAGMGKTRLCRALLESVASDDARRCLELNGAPSAHETTLEPIVVLIRRLLGERGADPAQPPAQSDGSSGQRHARPSVGASPLLALLPADLPDVEDKVAALALLLDVPAARKSAVLGMSSERRMRLTQEAATDVLAAQSLDAPLLVIAEDAHWLDRMTLEVVGMLAARARDLPVLLVLTRRSDFDLPADFPSLEEMQLPPLDSDQGASLVRSTALERDLAVETVDEIVRRSDGVPLHLRELTAMAMATGRLPAGAVPETLKGLLVARLQATGESAFDVALTATVIGRTFDREVLEKVLDARGVAAGILEPSIDRLVDAGLVEYGTGNELRFSHALVRDYAYTTLGRESTPIHAHVADALLSSGGVHRWPPEEIARHLERARRFVEAGKHWELAGRNAARRSNLDQCIEFYRRALDVLGSSESREASMLQCGVRLRLAAMIGQSKGWGARDIPRTLEPALRIARREEDDRLTFHLLTSLHTHLVTSERRAECDALTAEQQELAARIDQPLFHGRAHLNAILTHWFLGRTAEAVAHVQPALDALPVQDADSRGERIWCLIYAVQPLWAAGRTAAARRALDEAIELAQPLANPFHLVDAYLYGGVALGLMREHAAFERNLDEAIRISRRAGFTLMLPYARALSSWLKVARGDEAGLDGLRASWDEMTHLCEGYRYPQVGMLYADALRLCGRAAEARARATELTEYCVEISELCYVPELYRIRGEVELEDERPDEARESIETALRLSREAGSAALELRAATSLARVALATASAIDDSRSALSRVAARFESEPRTRDLEDALSALQVLKETASSRRASR
jgi:class 3 adenylate cyclase/tetratricopeptide (TPR) repeat protein